MSNYYEILSIQPAASLEDVQAAIDTKYNQCRRLVTHHDPNIVNQANMALQSLEKIRETLLSPERRAAYDEALGLGPVMGGLVDPLLASAAPVNTPMMVPPVAVRPAPPAYPPAPAPTGAPVDGWLCTKCNSVSQVGSLFCKSCGGEIGQKCPKCSTMFEKTAKFCPSCGVSPQQFADEQARANAEMLEKQRHNVKLKLNEAEAHLQNGLYGLAQDTLGAFEGLGNLKGQQVLCKRNEPEWQKAQMLNQNANVTRMAVLKQNALKITIGYSMAGTALGLLTGALALVSHISDVIRYQYAFQWPYLIQPILSGLGFGIGAAIAGALGSAIYFYFFGGRRSMNQDLLFGGLTPIALAIILPLGPTCFGIVIIPIGLWIGATLLGAGANRQS